MGLLFAGLYDAECIVGNPWFEGPSKECIWCRDVHKFEILNDTTDQDLITNYLREARPMVFQVGICPYLDMNYCTL